MKIKRVITGVGGFDKEIHQNKVVEEIEIIQKDGFEIIEIKEVQKTRYFGLLGQNITDIIFK